MLKLAFFCLIITFFCFEKSKGQSLGFEMERQIDRVDIPFEIENNFIVVKIIFQETFPVKFIFDTGAEHTILCKKELAEILGVNYQREFKIMGADMRTELTAFLHRNVSIRVSNSFLRAPHQDILVLDDDYFKLDESSGVQIAGILGADLFNRYVVKIDYVKRKISLYKSLYFSPPKGFFKQKITVEKGKPYFYPLVAVQSSDSVQLKILLDSGASIGMLLFTNTHPSLKLPPQYITGSVGNGLGGSIEGFSSKIHRLKVDEGIAFNNFVASFQEVDMLKDSSYRNTRNGIFGAQLLSRFTIYIDYIKEELYLKPNQNYNKKFVFDRSGLSLAATGQDLNIYFVNYVTPNSPASDAGFMAGDKILSINHLNSSFYSMEQVSLLFQRRVGKEYRILINRDGKRMVKKLVLRELL